MTTMTAMLSAFAGFTVIASLTWFLSYHPRLFIRAFVPREELRGAIRNILRDRNFGPAMRGMAMLQFSVAMIFGLVGLLLGWFK